MDGSEHHVGLVAQVTIYIIMFLASINFSTFNASTSGFLYKWLHDINLLSIAFAAFTIGQFISCRFLQNGYTANSLLAFLFVGLLGALMTAAPISAWFLVIGRFFLGCYAGGVEASYRHYISVTAGYLERPKILRRLSYAIVLGCVGGPLLSYWCLSWDTLPVNVLGVDVTFNPYSGPGYLAFGTCLINLALFALFHAFARFSATENAIEQAHTNPWKFHDLPESVMQPAEKTVEVGFACLYVVVGVIMSGLVTVSASWMGTLYGWDLPELYTWQALFAAHSLVAFFAVRFFAQDRAGFAVIPDRYIVVAGLVLCTAACATLLTWSHTDAITVARFRTASFMLAWGLEMVRQCAPSLLAKSLAPYPQMRTANSLVTAGVAGRVLGPFLASFLFNESAHSFAFTPQLWMWAFWALCLGALLILLVGCLVLWSHLRPHHFFGDVRVWASFDQLHVFLGESRSLTKQSDGAPDEELEFGEGEGERVPLTGGAVKHLLRAFAQANESQNGTARMGEAESTQFVQRMVRNVLRTVDRTRASLYSTDVSLYHDHYTIE